MRCGRVTLVGAGPGDPDLITRRGADALAWADVVVYDRLVAPALLDLARPGALLVDAGKAPGRARLDQAAINALLVEHAQLGRNVVRLKGGDPFVFGRGAEERAACMAASVPCEVVPGVSSAIAAPGAAGVPVTMRGIAHSFAVITAERADDSGSDADVASVAGAETVVVLMGRRRLGAIAQSLIDAGRSPDTPAVLVERATWPGQRVVSGMLSTIAAAAEGADIQPPATLVVGASAALAADGAAAADGSLHSRRVLVTRPPGASARLVRSLVARGAQAIECPLISVEPLEERFPTDAVRPDAAVRSTADGLRALPEADWIVFTSLHGVRGFVRQLERAGLDGRSLGRARLAAVGPRTAEELWSTARLRADLVPDEHRAVALIDAMAREGVAGKRVLFPCGTLARETLAEGLRAHGAEVTELVVYRTRRIAPTPDALRAIATGIDAILLYAPSAARSLVEHEVAIGDALVVCVGPTTAAEASWLGLSNIAIPARYGDGGVLELLEERLGPADRHLVARPVREGRVSDTADRQAHQSCAFPHVTHPLFASPQRGGGAA